MNGRSIGREMRCISNLIRRRLDNSQSVRELKDMTGTHGWAVGYLYDNRHRDIFQRDIEEEFHIRRSSATKLMQLMEKNGLIIRESVQQDARLKKIVLTEKALTLHEKFHSEAQKLEQGLLEGIDEKEIELFFAVLDKIKHNLDGCEGPGNNSDEVKGK